MPSNPIAQRNQDQLFGDSVSRLAETDPELVEYFGSFAFGEVYEHGSLDARTKLLVILAGLIGAQAQTEYRILLGAAPRQRVTQVEAKEVVYHAGFSMGIGRVYDVLAVTNQVLADRGVELPLPGQSTTTPETRFDAGWTAQEAVIGDRLGQVHESASADTKHLQVWLTANCFGDNYTRGGLDLPPRELLNPDGRGYGVPRCLTRASKMIAAGAAVSTRCASSRGVPGGMRPGPRGRPRRRSC